ncbi:MAG: C1 family peptidase [Actinomycetota bacterium]
METEGTAKKTTKDWRKQGLGWVPDYPDDRDYLLDSKEIQTLGNLRRNEVTKSIEDIADNLIQVLETLEDGCFPSPEGLKEIKTKLKQQVYGEFEFIPVKVYEKSLSFDPKNPTKTPEVRKLKYYFQLLSSHPNFSEEFKLIKWFDNDYSEYWQWMSDLEYDKKTEEIVKEFQKIVKIRIDGVVGLETYTAIGNYLRDPNHPLPIQDTPLVNLLPIPIWIQKDTFLIIFRTLKSWWEKFNEGNVKKGVAELLDQEDNFFELLKQEFFMIEPMASVITGKISPFVIHENLNLSLENALNYFENCDIDKPENLDIKGAILEVKKRIENELRERDNKPNKTNQEKLNIKFYKFILIIVEGYLKNKSSVASEELNKFAPKYLFEIIQTQDDSVKKSEQEDIVQRPTVSVLVNRNWLGKYPNEKNKKSYVILPSFVDLSSWCSPIRNQGDINSCTAFAGVALLEYFARRNKDESTYVSPLFLYKVARNLMNAFGDVGASVRETMKAMAAFGVPPEKYWPYEVDKFDEDPPAFCYSYAQSYKTLKYFRLDRSDLTKEILLFQIQAVLVAGFPCIFGFTVYSSIYNEENINKGYIPYPSKGDQVAGGHTVVAVGYDNYKEIKYSDGKGKSIGALLIRNSWGTEWGQKGYGWLPYDYITKGLTADWWSLIKAEWFEAGNFGLGAYAPGEGGDDQPVPQPKP